MAKKTQTPIGIFMESIGLYFSNFDKFLKYYPDNIRRIDVLKELRKEGILTADDSTRFTRNKYVKGKIVDMISVNRQFLEADTGELWGD